MTYLNDVDIGTGTSPNTTNDCRMAFPATSEDRLVIGLANSSLNTSTSGLLVIASRSGDVWSKEGQIQAATRIAQGRLGTAVFMDATGTRIYATSPGHTVSSVAVGGIYEFTRSGTTWSQNRITPSPLTTAGDGSFGRSLAVNSTGLVMVTGEHGRTGGGNVYVWTRTSVSGAWTLRQTITRPAGETSTQFGREVVVSKDGNILVILAAAADKKAYVFKANASWTTANLTYTYFSTLTTTHESQSLTMDGAGTLIAIGVNTDANTVNYTGGINVFQVIPSTGAWTPASMLTPTRPKKTAQIAFPQGGRISKIQYTSGETATPPVSNTTITLSATENSVVFSGYGSNAIRNETLGTWSATLSPFRSEYSAAGTLACNGTWSSSGVYAVTYAANSPSGSTGWVRQGSMSVREGLYGVTTYLINQSDPRWTISQTGIWEGTANQTSNPVVTWTGGEPVAIIFEGVTYNLPGGNSTTPTAVETTLAAISLTRNGSYGATAMIADNGLAMVVSANDEYLQTGGRGSFYVYGS